MNYLRNRLATLAQIGEDWLYLALLGIIMALLSFSMDIIISIFLSSRLWMFSDLASDNPLLQFLGWCSVPIILVSFSTSFVKMCSPTAIGSGIPEMKTILRGVVLNEYLTFRTLVAKVVGLTCTLGSGLPLGKEGPFVHMASIVATLLGKLIASFQGIYENESRASEMLSAACAVGVAATFYAPIGGVLFSIEVTTMYFAVRNYWRGFFAACCGATVWRLLDYSIKNDESISALFKTNFRTEIPFDPVELVAFSFIGATCGVLGAAYIKFHREIVQFFRRHDKLSEFLQRNQFVYPVLITFIITSVNYPPFLGKYVASKLTTHTTIEHLFSNRTWSLGAQDLVSKRILDEWTSEHTSFHVHLILYIAMLFWSSALASTIPIPSGLFIPVLKMGAAYGRLLGELMHQAFPEGLSASGLAIPDLANGSLLPGADTSGLVADEPAFAPRSLIVPGSYAVVGAAALSGAVTHTISTSVILFEMTGQIVHIIPVILGVLIANAVCQSLQPSIYDSIIEIKKLPYLPPIASSNSYSHKILARDFMNTQLAYIWKHKCTYADIKKLLIDNRKLMSFPLVESQHSMLLLGSVDRHELLKLLYLQLGRERRLQEVQTHRLKPQTSLGSPQLSAQVQLSLPVTVPVVQDQPTTTDETNSDLKCQPMGCDVTTLNQQQDIQKTNLNADLRRIYPRDTLEALGIDLDLDKTPQLHRKAPPKEQAEADKTAARFEQIKQLKASAHRWLSAARTPSTPPPTPTPPAATSKALHLSAMASSPGLAPSRGSRPGKSILKTSSSFSQLSSLGHLQKRASSAVVRSPTILHHHQLHNQQNQHINGSTDQQTTTTAIQMKPIEDSTKLKIRRRVKLPCLRVIDMTKEEQIEWENEQLKHQVDLTRCPIDGAPFQVVEQTSLFRVHTLFSMLGLNYAFVTSFGRLVGIVGLRDIRYAIERVLQGNT